MENNNIPSTNENMTAVLPAAPQGALSTRLTDNSPDYAWFDCEAEY